MYAIYDLGQTLLGDDVIGRCQAQLHDALTCLIEHPGNHGRPVRRQRRAPDARVGGQRDAQGQDADQLALVMSAVTGAYVACK